MARRKREITIDGKTFCKFHARWEPVEDFAWDSDTRNGTVSRYPRTNCTLAEQTLRDHGKESDPARAAIEGRAKDL